LLQVPQHFLSALLAWHFGHLQPSLHFMALLHCPWPALQALTICPFGQAFAFPHLDLSPVHEHPAMNDTATSMMNILFMIILLGYFLSLLYNSDFLLLYMLSVEKSIIKKKFNMLKPVFRYGILIFQAIFKQENKERTCQMY
jgi:hypothetical protein